MTRKRWIYIDGEAHEVTDGDSFYSFPMVMGDIQPYISQVTGEVIEGRRQHREHLRAYNLTEVGNETKYLKNTPREPSAGLKQTLVQVANEKLRWR